MLKRDIADELQIIAVKRYKSEHPEVELLPCDIEKIWYSIYGILQHEGEEKAREYALNAKLK